MFVNISPADWNTEETQTSLYYASRVKLITNESSKNVETKELSRMKKRYEEMQRRLVEMEGYITDNGLEMPEHYKPNAPIDVDDDEGKDDE